MKGTDSAAYGILQLLRAKLLASYLFLMNKRLFIDESAVNIV